MASNAFSYGEHGLPRVEQTRRVRKGPVPRNRRPVIRDHETNTARTTTNKGHVITVDLCDVGLLENHCWTSWKHPRRPAGSFYARASIGGRKQVGLHRLVLNAPRGVEVDHKDGDTLNNRRSNLRLATAKQNNHGFRKKKAGATSQYMGVSWLAANKKWAAQIGHNGGVKRLGLYLKEEDAALAFDEAVRRMRGSDAATNKSTGRL